MKLIQINEDVSKDIKNKIVVPMEADLAQDALKDDEVSKWLDDSKKHKKKCIKELKKNAEDLLKATAPKEKVIDPMLKESLKETMPGDENYFEIHGNDVYYKGHKFKLLDNSNAKNGIAKDSYFLIDPANYKLVDWGADSIEVAVADGYPQKACDAYLADLHEDFVIKGKDLTKNAAWNTGRLNMNAKKHTSKEVKLLDIANRIADALADAARNNPKGKEDNEIIWDILNDEFGNNENFNESLKEDFDEKSPEDNGISTIINSLVIDEWEAVDGYQSAIATIEQFGGHEEVKDILKDILDEEMVHIGQLQEANKYVEPATNNIEAGQNEANEEASEDEEELILK